MRIILSALALLSIAAAPPQLEVEQYTLDNGLTVVLSHDDRLPVVAVEVRYMVGSGHEIKGKSGFAHLFEHLMFQGSRSFDDEYFKPYTPIGAAVNGTTSNDRTNYYERVPRQHLELALWMESDRMEGLLDALTQAKLDNQRDVVKNERRQSYENRPYGMVWHHIAHTLYAPAHPYGHTTIGSHADLTAASLDDVKGFFTQYYVPANAVLTIVGDFDTAATRAQVVQYFGAIDAGTRAPRPTFEPPVLKADVHVPTTDNVKLPRLYLVWHTPALYAAGDAEMDALASVLTDGKTSRLYKPLVYEQKVAQSVAAYQVSRALGSLFVIEATAAPGQTIEALHTATLKALEVALATPATADEMERTLNAWKKSFFGRVEGVMPRAQLLSTYQHLMGTADYLAQDLARYTSLTPEAVHSAAVAYLVKAHHARIDVTPRPKEGAK